LDEKGFRITVNQQEKKIMPNYIYDLKTVLNGAVGSDETFCMGYLNPGASGNGYISTLKLSVGKVNIVQHGIELDTVTEGIVSYDRCEANDAYIGQINMLTASSFCGLNGAVWGYDLAIADNLHDKKLYDQPLPDGSSIPVFSVIPLLDATQRLFGIDSQRRFNPMPGAHVICANKNATSDGKQSYWMWSVIALTILKDRSSGSNLFIEDAGMFDGNKTEIDVENMLKETLKKVTKSVVLCGVDQGVEYKESFVGYRYLKVDKGEVGCALTCAPYVTLAKKAVPNGISAFDISRMSILGWEKALLLDPLPPLPPGEGTLGP